MGDIIGIDSKGRRFEFPTCYLSLAEYAKIVSEINTNYELYKDEFLAIHTSVGLDNRYYAYYFENHGFDEYNIVIIKAVVFKVVYIVSIIEAQ